MNELFKLITVLQKNEKERTEEPELVKMFVKCMGEYMKITAILQTCTHQTSIKITYVINRKLPFETQLMGKIED